MSPRLNPPIFPIPSGALTHGMSLRDWFASCTIQGLAAKGLEVRGDRCLSQDERDDELATRAYALADALLRIRSQSLPAQAAPAAAAAT